MTLKFLGISGSLRQKSANTGLLRTAQAQLPSGVHLVTADLSDLPFYNADLTDEEVTGLLNDLGAYLGNALNQYRVYISYRDETWVLQQEK